MSQCPDEVIPLLVTTCPHGQMDLTPIAASSIERRQVGDVPVPRVQVTEDQAEEQQCPHCHQQTRAAFPAGVGVPVQYGPRVGTMAVYLLIQQRLPWGRTREVLAERLGVPMSEGSLAPWLNGPPSIWKGSKRRSKRL